MKRFLTTFLFALSIITLHAQYYTPEFDKVFKNISRADATTGILYERVIPLANLTQYNSRINQIDTSNFDHFIMAYNELYRSTFTTPTLPYTTDSLLTVISNDTTSIDIGILHFKFNIMDTAIIRQKLYFDNDSILRENTNINASLYLEQNAFIASPLILTTYRALNVFKINSSLYFDNTANTIRRLNVDFGDGTGFHTVSFNSTIAISYATFGKKILHFMAILNNNDTIIATASLLYENASQNNNRSSGYPYYDLFAGNNGIEAKITPPNPYTGGVFSKAKGDVKIYYANADKILRKPILIVDGFDPEKKEHLKTILVTDCLFGICWEMA